MVQGYERDVQLLAVGHTPRDPGLEREKAGLSGPSLPCLNFVHGPLVVLIINKVIIIFTFKLKLRHKFFK